MQLGLSGLILRSCPLAGLHYAKERKADSLCFLLTELFHRKAHTQACTVGSKLFTQQQHTQSPNPHPAVFVCVCPSDFKDLSFSRANCSYRAVFDGHPGPSSSYYTTRLTPTYGPRDPPPTFSDSCVRECYISNLSRRLYRTCTKHHFLKYTINVFMYLSYKYATQHKAHQ